MGTSVTITGINFGATQGDSTVTFNGVTSAPTGWSANSIVVPVPAGAATGAIVVTVGSAASNGYSFAVSVSTSGPTITSLSPASGPVGTSITISGSNFGETQDSSTVTFNGTPVIADTWSPTSISVTVPSGATTGDVVVTVNGNASNGYGFTVATLVSIAVTPSSPTLAANTWQHFTATGTYSDNSVHDVTATATWTSSDNSLLLVSGSGRGFAIGLAPGSANITATSDAVNNNTFVTIVTASTPALPTIGSITPESGGPGTQVTLTGSGFGTTQGNGQVWLGTTYATVTSWGDTQVVASVASGSTSGTAQVQQGGTWSNSLDFTINTPNITAVSPMSGVPGTQVTISGSSFGTSQGTGSVWLGTAYGIVVSWNDTQVVATVAVGSTSGTVEILQNGIRSNPLTFTVNSPHITGISPTAGSPGSTVTIYGTGFGTTQGSGGVQLGSMAATVSTWSNTQIVALVSASSQNGIAQVTQNGILSNAVNFSVPSSGTTTTVLLTPNLLSMVVSDTRTLQALDSSGATLQGLTWTSSNNSVASLSPDDPPIITALAAGHVTITAGDGSADLTVYAGPTLPTGTIQWSAPDDGTGITNLVPAVPSSTGVADVFGLNYDCNLQAISSEGSMAWTVNIGQLPDFTGNVGRCSQFVPDFQGGAIIKSEVNEFVGSQHRLHYKIHKLDGITGQAYPTVNLFDEWWIDINAPRFPSPGILGNLSWIHTFAPTVVHPDGTVFTLDNMSEDVNGFPQGPGAVDVINPLTGQKIMVPIDTSDTGAPFNQFVFEGFGNLIIAGDGYSYVPYAFGSSTNLGYDAFLRPTCPTVGQDNLRLLRIGADGNSVSIKLGEYPTLWDANCLGTIAGVIDANVITNADQGVLVSWTVQTGSITAGGRNVSSTTHYVATTNGTNVVSQVTNNSPVRPMLQAQDGSFYGTDMTSTPNTLYHLDQSGNLKWSVGNDTPQIATADNGVIGASGATYDSSGNANGQMARLPTQSWRGSAYQAGSVDQLASALINMATSLWAQIGSNPSGGSTAARPWYFKLVWQNAFPLHPDNPQYLPNLSIDITSQAATMKSAALAALKKAYDKYPVNVSEGAAGTGDNRANVVDGANSQENGSDSCGLSSQFSGSHDSNVYYVANMEQAQWALPIVINNSQDLQQAAGRVDLMKAIGTGIGNNAGHEIAHQFFLDNYGMDDSSTDTYNGQGCRGDTAPWIYSGTSGTTHIHWENVTDQALQNALKSGWHN